jgi:hypothetical protein
VALDIALVQAPAASRVVCSRLWLRTTARQLSEFRKRINQSLPPTARPKSEPFEDNNRPSNFDQEIYET